MAKEGLPAARTMLEQSQSFSIEGIWQNRSKQPIRRLTESRKTAYRPNSVVQKRKGRAYIPTVMQEDNPEPVKRTKFPPLPERKAVVLKVLSREQVDPDFKGTDLEFATEYGHVTLHTKAEIEHHKKQDALMRWLGLMADFERLGRETVAAFAAVDPVTLQEWRNKPAKADKLHKWCNSLQHSLEHLRKLL